MIGRAGVRCVVATMCGIVAVAALGGLVAALVGGSFADLGSGAGGLWGVPSLATTLLALAAVPIAVALVARSRNLPRRWWAAVVVAGGAWMIALGYFVVAHAVDPCFNGWWDASSRIGDQPLCERFGDELNWHTRFHLLAHALPAVPMVVLYSWAVRRWALPDGDAPTMVDDSTPAPAVISTLD